MPAVFETERLVVRRLRPEDVSDLIAFASHPSVAVEIPNIPLDDPAQLAEYIESQRRLGLFEARKCVDLAIERKSDHKVIGLLTLVNDGKLQGEIGWVLGIEHRDRGYAAEAARGLIAYAFTAHKYHRLFAGTIFSNVRSWKLMERLGMRKEAHFREAHVPTEPGGPWMDTVRYAILASEWSDLAITGGQETRAFNDDRA